MDPDQFSSEILLPFIENTLSGKTTERLTSPATEPVPGLIDALNRIADELEGQRQAAATAAEKAHRAKTDFLTSMSHEIRTPLNAIMGMNQLLAENENDPQRREYLTVQRKACATLLGQIESVLELSNLEAGRLELESEEFHPETIINQAINLLAGRAEEKGLQVLRSLTSRLPETATGDPGRLHQILVHLLDNAIKFSEKGEIEISVEPDDDAPGHFRFCVRDTGIGIPRDRWETIFQTFARADESMTRRYGGTGMGLSICSRLLSLMGGRIWLESEVGAGSRFYFTLPLPAHRRPRRYTGLREVVNVHAAPAPEPDPTPDPRRELRVLLVEDNPDNQLLIKAYLHKTRHHLDIAANGRIGLEKFRASAYDLVLMDIQMPVMDGLTATKEIRRREMEEIEHGRRRRKTPIYALTAHAFKAEMLKSREAGCDRHIAKPLSKADFLKLIDELLAS